MAKNNSKARKEDRRYDAGTRQQERDSRTNEEQGELLVERGHFGCKEFDKLLNVTVL